MMSSSQQLPSVVLSHPSGNQFFRHLAMTLRDAGCLQELCTCIDWTPSRGADLLLPRSLRAQLSRRCFSAELKVPVATHAWRETARLLCGRIGLASLARHETGSLSVDAVYRDFDRWVAGRLARFNSPGTVYAYEDAAESTFLAAERLGWRRAYDLPIAYWETSRRLLKEEAQRHPAWEQTLGGTRDSLTKLARKTRELELAEVIVCPSRFVADSLPAAARRRSTTVIAPFGSPPAGPPRGPPQARGPLRVLFAGSMSQRKGLADLFAAVRLLARSDVELVVLGSPCAPMEFYRREHPNFTHETTRPHAEVLALMRTCDVLCLPSIVEGRALVIQEAMSQGLPAIITAHTGADDLIEEGRSGFLVPIRSPETIARRLEWLATHREALSEMSRAAQAAAAQVTWQGYGEKVVAALRQDQTGASKAVTVPQP